MLQITSAIACAHDSYIIHRDIKPQNVMILDDGVAKITDFGIATAMNSVELTQTNTVMGSVHYLPPEQANGKGSTVKSDIYSLGIMMYEMLIGKVPFKGDNAVEIAMKQINDPIPSVRSIDETIPQSVENIILKATAKNPKNRYNSVNEMHDDLVHALDEENTSVSRITFEFPEQELEYTKEFKVSELNGDYTSTKGDKGLNISLIIVSVIFVVLALALLIVVLVLPKVTEAKDVKIPNVAGLSLAEAEQMLRDLNLNVSDNTEERKDNNVEVDKVVGVKNYNPGDIIKEGKTLTLIISSGSDEVEIEDYVGKQFQEVEAILKRKGLQVIKEEVTTTDAEKYKADVIVKQSVEAKTKLVKGDIIRLYIETLEVLYPDFKTYSLNGVQNFCEEHNVTLEIEYVETTLEDPNTILEQSRQPGNVVREGTSIKIKVSKLPKSALDAESSSEE